MIASLAAGGVAGVVSWIPAVPFDVVKSLIQVCLESQLLQCRIQALDGPTGRSPKTTQALTCAFTSINQLTGQAELQMLELLVQRAANAIKPLTLIFALLSRPKAIASRSSLQAQKWHAKIGILY